MAADYSWHTVFSPGEAEDFFEVVVPGPFDPFARRFEPVNAWWLSELSRLIYRRDFTEGVADTVPRRSYLSRVGLVERRFFNRPGVQAVLVDHTADDAAYRVLVFRGTAGRLANWRFNLNLLPRPWPKGGAVHRGFYHLFMTIWEDIAPVLDAIQGPLFYTGHSLGGALATLAASYRPPSAAYTFGAPRVGDAAFADSVTDVALYQVLNRNDIVPHLPPSGRKARFVHAGTVVHNPQTISPRRLPGQAPTFLADHAPFNYTIQLAAHLAN